MAWEELSHWHTVCLCCWMQRLGSLLLCRQQELTEELHQRQAEAAEAASELARAQEVCREMLNARRNAREALSDMAQQNARLVSAYVEKKQELRQMQDSMRDERLQWQVSTGCWLAGTGAGQHTGQAAATLGMQDALRKMQWQGPWLETGWQVQPAAAAAAEH